VIPLPEPEIIWPHPGESQAWGYTANQMHAYAATREAAAVAVERERCAKVCETFQAEAESNAGKLWTRACADAIRAGSAGGES
jgi:hypothetical protein